MQCTSNFQKSTRQTHVLSCWVYGSSRLELFSNHTAFISRHSREPEGTETLLHVIIIVTLQNYTIGTDVAPHCSLGSFQHQSDLPTLTKSLHISWWCPWISSVNVRWSKLQLNMFFFLSTVTMWSLWSAHTEVKKHKNSTNVSEAWLSALMWTLCNQSAYICEESFGSHAW